MCARLKFRSRSIRPQCTGSALRLAICAAASADVVEYKHVDPSQSCGDWNIITGHLVSCPSLIETTKLISWHSASIATLIRVKYLIDLENVDDLLCKYFLVGRTVNKANVNTDAGTDALIWTIIEPGLSIVAASIATLRPLLKALKVIGFGSSGFSRHAARSQGGVGLHGRYARPEELGVLKSGSGTISTKIDVNIAQAARDSGLGSQEEIWAANRGQSSTRVWVSDV